jgi:hypothetical protein
MHTLNADIHAYIYIYIYIYIYACLRPETWRLQLSKKPEMSWVSVPVRMDSVAWKLTMTEEWRRDQTLYRQGDDRNKDNNPAKYLLGFRVPEEMVSLSQKLGAIYE